MRILEITDNPVDPNEGSGEATYFPIPSEQPVKPVGATRRSQVKNVAHSKARYFKLDVDPPESPPDSQYFVLPATDDES
jgi:hypothetical protein